MKKALILCILAVMLSSCANNAKEDDTAAPAVSRTNALNTTVSDLPPETASADITVSTLSATTAATSDNTTDASDILTSRVSEKHTTTRKAVTSLSKTDSKVKTELTEKTSVTKAEEKVTDMTAISESYTKASETKAAVSTATSKAVTTATQKTLSTSASTVKTKQSTATEKPKQTTTAAKSQEEQYAVEFWEIVERKGLEDTDATCLETMILNLKYSDTPPSYYEKIGRGLANDGTDYGKAKAVYKWMLANGWGSCVYYSMETYFVCKGIGLECAYGFATDNDWYGHTYSVVKVDGTWYVMDTQGKSFLYNSELCTRMFDGNDNDLKPFKRWIWYDYDENGEYRDWSISD